MKLWHTATFLLLGGLLCIKCPLQAQDLSVSSGAPPEITAASGILTYAVSRGGATVASERLDLNEEVRVIVQFQSPPLAFLRKEISPPNGITAALAGVQAALEREHAAFRADLARLRGGRAVMPALKASAVTIHQEFHESFNGAAFTARRWLTEELRRLPYVRTISPDRSVHAVDAASAHQVRADSLHTALGLTGHGVRLGVFDSGIDYLHPALGGGFGPGHTVAGGWDFINNNADPMDDNGHGTHVAGILAGAATSPAAGIAPGATLYAYKVLDANGEGYSSLAMAALEKALDPDGDPATDDHLDIVNLSLGGPGDPGDPLSQAVDNATAAGVLCVVAAGNNGPGYQTIGSPGCAGGALTVGACDGGDNIASFSSRGPTNALYSLKPDLVAPGVSITSTILGSGFQEMTGTSMAAPHVAGAAALLKELHPDWMPEKLKSAIMGSAQDLGVDAWTGGSGRLDALAASRLRAVVVPQTLSFGLCGMSEPSWAARDTLTVVNLTDSLETFTFEAPALLPAGLTLTYSATSLTVPAHGQGSLIVTLDVDTHLAQIPQTDPPAVSSTVRIHAAHGEVYRLPWTVLLGSYIDLELTGTAGFPHACITEIRSGTSFTVNNLDFSTVGQVSRFRRLVSPGLYQMIAFLGSVSTGEFWMVRDSIVVNPAAHLQVSQGEAIYQVGTVPTDETGATLSPETPLYFNTWLTSKRTGVGFGYGGSLGFSMAEAHLLGTLCPLSEDYAFDYFYTTDPNLAKLYTYAGSVSPVNADHVVQLKPGDLIEREVRFQLHSAPSRIAMMEWFTMQNTPSPIGSWAYQTAYLTRPFSQRWFATEQPAVEHFPWNGYLINFQKVFSYSGIPPFAPDACLFLMQTPNQYPGSDGVLRSSLSYSKAPLLESRGRRITYGLGPRHYFGRMQNDPTLLRVKTNTYVGLTQSGQQAGSEAFLPLFLNQAMDNEPQRLSFWLRDSTGHVLSSGTSLDHLKEEGTVVGRLGLLRDRSLAVSLPEAGRYTLKVWDPASYVLTAKGAAWVVLSLDTRLSDKNPPAMTSFSVLGPDGEYTDQVQAREQATVNFRVGDAETGLASVALFWCTGQNPTWQSLPLTRAGEYYQTVLPALFSEGLLSLRMLATDSAGNSLDYYAEPALYVGDSLNWVNRPPGKAIPDLPAPGATLQLYSPRKKVTFQWAPATDPDSWDTLSYTFQIRGPGLKTDAHFWSAETTASFDVMAALQPDSLYRWWVETTDGYTVTPSDTVSFRVSKTILDVKGGNGTEQEPPPMSFALKPNYPNPFNPSTTIEFDLPVSAQIRLTVFDLLGREVTRLAEGFRQAGYHTVTWNAQNAASGFYFLRLTAADQSGNVKYTKTNRLLLTR